IGARADPGPRHRRPDPARHRRRGAGRGMKLVVFGLTITSSWGNGHATLWRGLCKARPRSHHHTAFFERDVPYYAGARDCAEVPGGRLVLYSEGAEVRRQAEHGLRDCDAAIVTSYCPDGIAAG